MGARGTIEEFILRLKTIPIPRGWICPSCDKLCKKEFPRVCRECHWDMDLGMFIEEWKCKKCDMLFNISGCRLCLKCGWCEDCMIFDD